MPDGGQKTAKSRENKQQRNSGILCDPEKKFFGPKFVFGPSFLPFHADKHHWCGTLGPGDPHSEPRWGPELVHHHMPH